jgi:hypothetical protein
MPPQQPDRLLDFSHDGLDFGTHVSDQASAIRTQGSATTYRALAGTDQQGVSARLASLVPEPSILVP